MRKIVLTIAAAAIAALPLAAPANPRLTGEQRLAKILDGREAGKPTGCISHWDSRDMEIIDRTAIVYRAGSVIWVNRPVNANQLDDDNILVTRTTGNELCKLDIVTTMDRSAHFMNGVVSLGDFVPYRKADAAKHLD